MNTDFVNGIVFEDEAMVGIVGETPEMVKVFDVDGNEVEE